MALTSLKLQCYTVWMTHHTILQRGRVLKVLASPIQGHTSILESDSNQSGTHLLLTDNNICHNIVWPIHFLQACRKCTWKPYVLSYLVMYTRHLFAPQDVSLLCELYTKLYCLTSISQVEVCSAYKKYKTVCINNRQLGSYKSRSCNSSVVLASYMAS